MGVDESGGRLRAGSGLSSRLLGLGLVGMGKGIEEAGWVGRFHAG